jgi:hypothetical protein
VGSDRGKIAMAALSHATSGRRKTTPMEFWLAKASVGGRLPDAGSMPDGDFVDYRKI